jgi:hypothetical protein
MISQPTHEQTISGSITLTATGKVGASRHYELQSDQGVFIGSSSNCGLQLRGDKVADIECRIDLKDGILCLQNWISAEGTRLNGKPISEATDLHIGDVIEIQDHEISVESSDAVGQASRKDDGEITEQINTDDVPFDEPEDSRRDTPTSAVPASETLASETLASCSPEPDATTCDAPESMDLDCDFFAFEEEETYDAETVALLRAEIEELQTALAQRDAEQNFDRPDSYDQEATSSAPVEASDQVLQRMQELIDEANVSDERVSLLEEMLHASEATNRSEHEERDQLEAWVGDIEQRIGQREDEHLAEVETLRNRLEESNLRQEQLQKQLQKAAFSGNAPKQYEETLENLQRTNKELQEKLGETEKRCLSLERKAEQASGDQDSALREERANIAKETAKISRLRFELSSKLTEIEHLPKDQNLEDKETAHRIRALREHLKEIHEQEKLEEKDAPLTKRLAKLWKRVEY